MSSDLNSALDTIADRARLAPVAVVFADSGYGQVLRNWLSHAGAAGFDNTVVLALDDGLFGQAREAGLAAARIPFSGRLPELWVTRARLFAKLCRAKIDFIHSDADAVWLRNPVDRAFGLNVDLAFSQGTIWPPDIVQKWGFVLCCGFFAVRGSPSAAKYFTSVAKRATAERDDQAAVNRTLDEMSLVWRKPTGGQQQTWNKRAFVTFDQPVMGVAPALTAALLPHGEFSRLPDTIGRFVAHPLSAKTAVATAVVLKGLGLWRV